MICRTNTSIQTPQHLGNFLLQSIGGVICEYMPYCPTYEYCLVDFHFFTIFKSFWNSYVFVTKKLKFISLGGFFWVFLDVLSCFINSQILLSLCYIRFPMQCTPWVYFLFSPLWCLLQLGIFNYLQKFQICVDFFKFFATSSLLFFLHLLHKKFFHMISSFMTK